MNFESLRRSLSLGHDGELAKMTLEVNINVMWHGDFALDDMGFQIFTQYPDWCWNGHAKFGDAARSRFWLLAGSGKGLTAPAPSVRGSNPSWSLFPSIGGTDALRTSQCPTAAGWLFSFPYLCNLPEVLCGRRWNLLWYRVTKKRAPTSDARHFLSYRSN